MDKRLLVLALGMFALGTDSFVMAGTLRINTIPRMASGYGTTASQTE